MKTWHLKEEQGGSVQAVSGESTCCWKLLPVNTLAVKKRKKVKDNDLWKVSKSVFLGSLGRERE